MTKILNFALKIKWCGKEGGPCEVLQPCHSQTLKRAPTQPRPMKLGRLIASIKFCKMCNFENQIL